MKLTILLETKSTKINDERQGATLGYGRDIQKLNVAQLDDVKGHFE